MATPTSEPIIGIDLGTTYSLVAVAGWPLTGAADERKPRIIPDEQGRPLCPSVVRFDIGKAEPVVGYDARDRAAQFSRSTIASVKRLMGRALRDVAADLPSLGYRVVAGEGDTARIAVPHHESSSGIPADRLVSPQEVSAHILRHLKRQAERALGTPVSKAVVTVPAYFDDAQRQATRDAGRLAGLDVVRIVNEPTAAALAYGLGVGRAAASAPARHVVVFDLGGGTFDVSVLRITPAAPTTTPGDSTGTEAFQVLSTAGDTHLGGDDIDQLLMNLLAPELPGDGALPALRAAAERAKIELSSADSARVSMKLDGRTPVDRTITRPEFDALIAPLIERAIDCCRRALRDAKRQLGGAPIDAVVLVGGSTRIPLVRRRVADVFGLEPYTALDPDQVVALGAAVQASILSGSRDDALLLDVIPLSLGIETVGGAVAKIIMRNSPVPAQASEMFSTSVDKQTGIELAVYQGEREMAADCRLLGHFKLGGIPPMPAGIPQVRVTFSVDASGVLSVHAAEQRSGKRASLQVVPNHGLSRAEVEAIERDSFAHAREDMTRHRLVDLLVNAKLDLHWITPRFAKLGSRLESPARTRLDTAITTLRSLIESADRDQATADPDALHRAKDELDRASMPLHELSILESLQRDAPPHP